MTKHIIDNPDQPDDGERLKRFTELERKSGDPAQSAHVKSLHRQPKTPEEDPRAEEYARIERGKEA